MNEIKKTAMITIAGRPNVGKSTLTNALVGEKIAIVSPKPQTTRNRICGVVNRGETQFVFLDTPGFHRARTRLGDYMVKVVKDSVADVEAVCLMVEPIAKVGAPEQELIDRIKEEKLPAVLVIPRRHDHRPAGETGGGGDRPGEVAAESGQGGPPRDRHRGDEVLRAGQRGH